VRERHSQWYKVLHNSICLSPVSVRSRRVCEVCWPMETVGVFLSIKLTDAEMRRGQGGCRTILDGRARKGGNVLPGHYRGGMSLYDETRSATRGMKFMKHSKLWKHSRTLHIPRPLDTLLGTLATRTSASERLDKKSLKKRACCHIMTSLA
jgi:hypothetical protein